MNRGLWKGGAGSLLKIKMNQFDMGCFGPKSQLGVGVGPKREASQSFSNSGGPK